MEMRKNKFKTSRRFLPKYTDSDYYMLMRLRSWLENIVHKFLNNNKKYKIFDYGCGEVPYRKLFSPITKSYVGGDISGNPFADITLEPTGIVPVDSGTFDIVLSIQVLEHVPEPNSYIKEVKRILKNDGIFILSTHGWWTHHPFPNDYWRWTYEGLEYLLKENGFKIVTSDWIIGMLAYSCQLRLQCWKGVLENKGNFSANIFKMISFVYQICMKYADRITPEHIGKNNASVYAILAKK